MENEEKGELGEAPEQEVKVWGLGVLLNKLDELIKLSNKQTNVLLHLENKVEALMDENAQKRHEQIRRRFQ